MTFETKNIGGETPEQLSASPRLFESDLLDKLSRVHHLTPVIIYTPIILGLIDLFADAARRRHSSRLALSSATSPGR